MTTEARITKLIAEQTQLAQDHIQPGDELVANLGCDSLDLLEMVMAVEDEFDIELDDDAFIALKTVQQVVDYVDYVYTNKEARP